MTESKFLLKEIMKFCSQCFFVTKSVGRGYCFSARYFGKCVLHTIIEGSPFSFACSCHYDDISKK